MPNNDVFNALVEGRLGAEVALGGGIKLYQYEGDQPKALLASFTDESTFCQLIGGFTNLAAFREAMAERAKAFAPAEPKQESYS